MHCKRAMALFGVTMSLLIGISNVFALESNTQDIDTLDNINGIQNHRGVLVDQGKFTNELYYDDVDAWDIIDEDAVDFEVRINPDKNKIYIKYFQDDGLGLMTLKNGSYYDVYRVNDNLTLSLYNGEGLYTLGLYRRIDLTSGKSHEQDVLRIESSNNTSIPIPLTPLVQPLFLKFLTSFAPSQPPPHHQNKQKNTKSDSKLTFSYR